MKFFGAIAKPLNVSDLKDMIDQLESGEFGAWESSGDSGGERTDDYPKVSRDFLRRFSAPPKVTCLMVDCLLRSQDKIEVTSEDQSPQGVDFFRLPPSCYGKLMINFSDPKSRKLGVWVSFPSEGGDMGSIKLAGSADVFESLSVDGLGLSGLLKVDWELIEEASNGVVVKIEKRGDRFAVKIDDCEESVLCSFIEAIQDFDFVGGRSILSLSFGVGYMDEPEILESGVAESLAGAVASHTNFESYSLSISWIDDHNGDRESLRLSAQNDRVYREELGSLINGDVRLRLFATYGFRGYLIDAWSEDLSLNVGAPAINFLQKYHFEL